MQADQVQLSAVMSFDHVAQRPAGVHNRCGWVLSIAYLLQISSHILIFGAYG